MLSNLFIMITCPENAVWFVRSKTVLNAAVTTTIYSTTTADAIDAIPIADSHYHWWIPARSMNATTNDCNDHNSLLWLWPCRAPIQQRSWSTLVNSCTLVTILTNFLTSQDCIAMSNDSRTALARFIGWSWESGARVLRNQKKIYRVDFFGKASFSGLTNYVIRHNSQNGNTVDTPITHSPRWTPQGIVFQGLWVWGGRLKKAFEKLQKNWEKSDKILDYVFILKLYYSPKKVS